MATIFTKIAKGEIPSYKVAENEETDCLRSNLQQMNDMLTADGADGRKLDFLL